MPAQKRSKVFLGAVLALTLLPSARASEALIGQTRQAITKAVDFLLQAQQPEGSFRVYRCVNLSLTDCTPTTAAAPTAFVLKGVSAAADPRAAALIEKGARLLHRQVDDEGWLSYVAGEAAPLYGRSLGELAVTCAIHSLLEDLGFALPSILPKLMTYQTIDGTFHSAALPLQDVAAIKAAGAAREQFVQRFGKPRLGFVEQVDPLTNAEVFAYLVRHRRPSPELCDYLVRVAKQEPASEGSATSAQVYEHEPHFSYSVSRAYANGASCLEPAKAALQARLLGQWQPNGSYGPWGGITDTALAAVSLMQFGYTGEALDRAVEFLLSQQQADGSWKRAIMWEQRSDLEWYVSEELSTGRVLEALGTYLKVRLDES